MASEIKPEPSNGTAPLNGHGPKIANDVDAQDTSVPIQIIAPNGATADQGPTLMDILANPEAVKAITEMVNKWMETYANVTKPKVAHSSWRLVGIFMIIVLVIAAASLLTYAGKMDSGSLTFLFGAIVGSLITFVSKLELGE
jgi:hypothetical protein